MPITKSAIKRMRSNARKADRNTQILSRLHTLYKKFVKLTTANELEDARKNALVIVKEYDKAVTKGVIPKMRANRKKARIAQALNKLSAAQSSK